MLLNNWVDNVDKSLKKSFVLVDVVKSGVNDESVQGVIQKTVF